MIYGACDSAWRPKVILASRVFTQQYLVWHIDEPKRSHWPWEEEIQRCWFAVAWYQGASSILVSTDGNVQTSTGYRINRRRRWIGLIFEDSRNRNISKHLLIKLFSILEFTIPNARLWVRARWNGWKVLPTWSAQRTPGLRAWMILP